MGNDFRNGKKIFLQVDWSITYGRLRQRSVRRIKLDPNGKVLNQEQIAIGARVRDIRQGPDEFLYILTDESQGQLIRLEPGKS